MKLEFEAFLMELKNKVQDFYGQSYEVELHKIEKNNGVFHHGLVIREEGSNVYPTIYLDRLYEEYGKGKEMSKMVVEISEVYERRKLRGNMDVKTFISYEHMKDKLVFKLVNRDRNRAFLTGVPYVSFLDMAVVFYCRIDGGENGGMSVTVTHQMKSAWGITIDELKEQAMKNAPRILSSKISDIRDVLGGGGKLLGNAMEGRFMYVLTNKDGYLGAAVLLYPDVLKDFGRALGKDFYLLPSSIHECILVPVHKNCDRLSLLYMVKDINRTQVEPEEVLSDSVYYYSCREDKLSICCTEKGKYQTAI